MIFGYELVTSSRRSTAGHTKRVERGGIVRVESLRWPGHDFIMMIHVVPFMIDAALSASARTSTQ